MSESSTFGELTAVFLSLDAFATDLRSHAVSCITDNHNVVSTINHESKVHKLQSIAMQIFRKCLRCGITLVLHWDQNQAADQISKIIDFDNYTVNDDSFHFLDQL